MSHSEHVHSATTSQAEAPCCPCAAASTCHASYVQERTAEGRRASQGQQQAQAAPQQTGAAEPQPAAGAAGAAASMEGPGPVGNDLTAKSRLYRARAVQLYREVRPLQWVSVTLSTLHHLECCGTAG